MNDRPIPTLEQAVEALSHWHPMDEGSARNPQTVRLFLESLAVPTPPAQEAVALRDNDAVWAAFYRDGMTLGQIAEKFGVSIYALSPWIYSASQDQSSLIKVLTEALEGAADWMVCVEDHIRDTAPFKKARSEFMAALALAKEANNV